jgi:hypothetical protein
MIMEFYKTTMLVQFENLFVDLGGIRFNATHIKILNIKLSINVLNLEIKNSILYGKESLEKGGGMCYNWEGKLL